MNRLLKLFLLLLIVSSISSCKILNSSMMLRTPRNYQYSEVKNDTIKELYKLSVNDKISFRLYANDGFKLLDLSSAGVNEGGQTNMRQGANSATYDVEYDGMVKLPILGRQKVAGMTLREFEFYLQDKYSEYYNKPYAMVEITNRRVTIFPGGESSAKVLGLVNENTTLFEALAFAGGISSTGKAYRVKLIRGDISNPKVYLFDLSTLESAKNSGIILQANDIIYVEPRYFYAKNISQEITPYLGLISTLLQSLTLFYTVKNLNLNR